MLPAAFKHLGVTILLRVTTAISYVVALWQLHMAAAQPFPISIDADCIAHVYVLLHS